MSIKNNIPKIPQIYSNKNLSSELKIKNLIIIMLLLILIISIIFSYYFVITKEKEQSKLKVVAKSPNIEQENTVQENPNDNDIQYIINVSENLPVYYSYNAFNDRFEGPYTLENIKTGDGYAKFDSAGAFNRPRTINEFFDKNRKVLDVGENCSDGETIIYKGKIYNLNTWSKVQNINGTFVCDEMMDRDYKYLSLYPIYMSTIKPNDKINVAGYKNYILVQDSGSIYYFHTYDSFVNDAPLKGETQEIMIINDSGSGSEEKIYIVNE